MMLSEAILISFGKFHNQKISFSDGFQVLYGENEAGKSTLQLFFRVMLYGCKNNRRNVPVKDRERVIPWGEKCAEGILRIEHDGKKIEIYRKIGKTAAGDELTVSDANTGEKLPEYSGKQPGEVLLNLSEEAFIKTFWLQQNTAAFQGKDEELGRKLLNLRHTGDEEISADKAQKALEKEEDRLIAKSRKNNDRVIDFLKAKREEKILERRRILDEREQRKAQQHMLASAEQEFREAEAEIVMLTEQTRQKELLLQEKHRKEKQADAANLTRKYKELTTSPDFLRYSGLSEETVSCAENLELQIKTLDQTRILEYDRKEEQRKINVLEKRKRSFLLICGIGVMFLIFALIYAICRFPFWQGVTAIGAVVCAGMTAFGIAAYLRTKRSIADIGQRLSEDAEKQKKIGAEREELQEQLQKILYGYRCDTAAKLRNGFSEYQGMQIRAESFRSSYRQICGEDITQEELPIAEGKPFSEEEEELLRRDLVTELNAAQEKKQDALAEIKGCEGKLSYVYRETQNPADITAEIDAIEKDIQAAELRLRAVRLALEVFSGVYEKRKTDFTPLINQKVEQHLAVLTKGVHESVRVSDDYAVHLSGENLISVPAEALSTGALEQVYLALRLALGELVGSGCEPIFLDDCLVTFDDTRGKAAVTLLCDIAGENNRQIFLFTCHSREVRLAQEMQVKVLDMKEEMNYVG